MRLFCWLCAATRRKAAAKSAACVPKHSLTLHLHYSPQTLLLSIAEPLRPAAGQVMCHNMGAAHYSGVADS